MTPITKKQAERRQSSERALDISDIEPLIDRYGPGMNRHALKIVRSTELAEDIVQEVFAKTIEEVKSGRYICASKAKSWLHVCVRNTALSVLREQQRHSRVRLEDYGPIKSRENTHETVQTSQRSKAVIRTMLCLTERQSTALLLTDLHGMDYKQAATSMNTSPDSVRQLLFRARSELRRRLGSILTSPAVFWANIEDRLVAVISSPAIAAILLSGAVVAGIIGSNSPDSGGAAFGSAGLSPLGYSGSHTGSLANAKQRVAEGAYYRGDGSDGAARTVGSDTEAQGERPAYTVRERSRELHRSLWATSSFINLSRYSYPDTTGSFCSNCTSHPAILDYGWELGDIRTELRYLAADYNRTYLLAKSDVANYRRMPAGIPENQRLKKMARGVANSYYSGGHILHPERDNSPTSARKVRASGQKKRGSTAGARSGRAPREKKLRKQGRAPKTALPLKTQAPQMEEQVKPVDGDASGSSDSPTKPLDSSVAEESTNRTPKLEVDRVQEPSAPDRRNLSGRGQ